MFNRVIAKVKSVNAKLEAWNFADYDRSQSKIIEAQLEASRKQDEAVSRIVNSSGSYSDWFRKVQQVKTARHEARRQALLTPAFQEN